MIIVILAMPFIVSALLTYYLCSPTFRFGILDHPNERSLHRIPVPRSGGLAILMAVLLTMLTLGFSRLQDVYMIWIGVGMITIAIISFLDDRATVHPFLRLIIHVIVGGALVYAGLIIHSLELPFLSWDWSEPIAVIMTMLFIVWMINLYNFMDGMDGFAAGMATSGFGFVALLGWSAGDVWFGQVNLIIAAASLGFLIFNYPPARIFMGDVGSSTLGFMAAAISLWGVRTGLYPFWAAVLIFSPFIADATVTLIRRILMGEKFWKPHKTHYYQRLVQAGWGHHKTLVLEYGIMLACGISALVSVDASATVQVVVLSVWVLFYIIFFSWISRISSKQRS